MGSDTVDLVGLDEDAFLTQLRPLIAKYARHYVPGYTFDDLSQEISIVLLRCRVLFREDVTGYGGRRSSFLNYAIHAIENTLRKLGNNSRRFYRPSVSIRCRACDMSAGISMQWKQCPGCGGRRWVRGFDSTLKSTDAVGFTSPPADNSDPMLDIIESETIVEMLSGLSAEAAATAIRLMRGDDVAVEDVRRVRREVRRRNKR